MVDRQFEEARKTFSKMEAFVKSMHKTVGSSNKAFLGKHTEISGPLKLNHLPQT